MSDDGSKSTKPERPGWPLDHIPPGRANWEMFCRLATDEQVDRVIATVMADLTGDRVTYLSTHDAKAKH